MLKQTRSLRELLDFEKLKNLFETYHKATGLNVALYSSAGEEQLLVRGDDCICGLVGDRSVCINKLVYSGAKSAELAKPYIYQTACGLIMCITPVAVDGDAVGFIAIGPVILWDKEDFFIDEFVQLCESVGVDTANPSFDPNSIKHVDCETMTGLADMLTIMVDYMVEKENAIRSERAEREKAAEELKARFELVSPSAKNYTYRRYPLELEKELITHVQLGDKQKARSLINDLLTEILLFADGDLNIIKAKLYELMAFFSRSAVESGAEIKSLTEIVKKSSKLLLENIDYQDICRTTIDILDEYLNVVYKSRGGKPAYAHLAAAISFINENYADRGLSLKVTAAQVYLSPYYISHLFRYELNTTFVEYLTKVRVDKAKELLAAGVSCEETAERAGFRDASYFTKIFKKFVGITPAKYRKKQ